MTTKSTWTILVAALLTSTTPAQNTDSTAHTVQFITVDENVKLEVLDWGGSGRPVVLLTGMGNNAHVFDKFAPKLTASYHLYGITRRGFGASSHPDRTTENYAADRLGDDVLAVIDSLKLNRPVLVGHSLGGEEMSSVGSRHPEKVSGLVYLDAGYGYAYYDRSRGDIIIDMNVLQQDLKLLNPGNTLQQPASLIKELLETDLPALEKDLRRLQEKASKAPVPADPRSSIPPVEQALLAGMQKYTDIHVPILAIYAIPHEGAPDTAWDLETTGAQAAAFEKGLPSARVVRLEHANHYVFQSNEADVLREINDFVGKLPE
jgi:non-heme chloroperoxidase